MLALWSLCLAALLAAVASAEERVGTVAGVEGRAEVLHPGAGEWLPLAEGDPVLLGDELRTQADGKLRLVLREDSVLTLAPGSHLAVSEQLLAPTAVSRFQLLLGTVKALVTERYSEPRARFEVETPTAIAGVRGTSFIAAYDPAEDETLVVGLEHVTRVRARLEGDVGDEVEVGPGMATRVRRGRRPLSPRSMAEGRLRALRGATQLGPGAGAAIPSRRRANALDARRPARAGERALTREEQAVDQPLFNPRRPKPPPPPPPIPRSGR